MNNVNVSQQTTTTDCFSCLFLFHFTNLIPIKMETEKKKRSPNYTNEEKENLLGLVTKYKDVIDSKKTGAYYIQKKKEAWVAITKEYNSICTTGPRDEAMLKHFYNNVKHRARKVTACANKQRYLADMPIETNSTENIQRSDVTPVQVESSNDYVPIDANIIKDLKIKWIDEKKNIKKTGGGSYDPVLTDADHQILSIMDDHIRPDENAYDEAAEYFGDTIEVSAEDEPNQTQQVQKVKTRPPKSVSTVKRKCRKNLKSEIIQNKSVELLRKIYFKKKIELVYYQKKNEMQKFRYEKIKNELEIKILKKQLERADGVVPTSQ